MAKITPVSWQEFEKFLLYIGCEYKRKKGSHRIYHKPGLNRPIVVPEYKELPVFIIRNNLRTLDIDPKQYLEILKQL